MSYYSNECEEITTLQQVQISAGRCFSSPQMLCLNLNKEEPKAETNDVMALMIFGRVIIENTSALKAFSHYSKKSALIVE